MSDMFWSGDVTDCVVQFVDWACKCTGSQVDVGAFSDLLTRGEAAGLLDETILRGAWKGHA